MKRFLKWVIIGAFGLLVLAAVVGRKRDSASSSESKEGLKADQGSPLKVVAGYRSSNELLVIFNDGDKDWTNVKVTVNGEYINRVPVNGKAKSMGAINIKHYKNAKGTSLVILDADGIESIKIESDQGTWTGGLSDYGVYQKKYAEFAHPKN